MPTLLLFAPRPLLAVQFVRDVRFVRAVGTLLPAGGEYFGDAPMVRRFALRFGDGDECKRASTAGSEATEPMYRADFSLLVNEFGLGVFFFGGGVFLRYRAVSQIFLLRLRSSSCPVPPPF